MPNLINQYWPIYLRLERSVEELTHSIHINDEQLDVYSSEIADLIIRIGAEIEAISKSIYRRDFDSQMDAKAKFDDVALKGLTRSWKIDQKVAILTHPNCFCSDRIFQPFQKDTVRTGSARKTFAWNNAYQNLKHNREKAFSFASVRFLLSGMAALYILNLYYRDEVIELDDDHSATRIATSLGSQFFSVQFSEAAFWDEEYIRQPKGDFGQSVYFVDREKIYAEKLKEAYEENEAAFIREILRTKEGQEAVKKKSSKKRLHPNWLLSAVPKDILRESALVAEQTAPTNKLTARYQAFLNRNQVPDKPNSS